MIRYKLAEQIERKQFEESRRITMQDITGATGLNRSTLSKILNVKGYSTSTDVLDRLCGYFGCAIGQLVEYVESDADLKTHDAQSKTAGHVRTANAPLKD